MPEVMIDKAWVHLDAADLIQAGGEGMVFGWGDQAVKVYHQANERQRAKLRFWLDSGLAARLPAHVLGPRQLVADKMKQIAGFTMRRLPAGAEPLRRLAQPAFCAANDIQIPVVAQLLQTAQDTLAWLHRQGIVVGDLSDSNLFFLPGAPAGTPAYWLDGDSYQLPGHPCPVATAAFVDPCLYDITGEFGDAEHFSPATDWYAFAVLVLKCLLQVHPFGGTHPRHKTLTARARAGLSLLAPDVRYPARARPLETLPDAALQQVHEIFARGARPLGAPILTAALAGGWRLCGGCGLTYSAERRACPACRRTRPVPPQAGGDPYRWRRLWGGAGQLAAVLARPDRARLAIVVRTGRRYAWHELGAGGPARCLPLFSSAAAYRFAAFGDCLVVNPAGSAQLLILDISGSQPRQVTLTETDRFNHQPAFAAGGDQLFRLAGGYLLRGAVQHGHYVESIAGDARQAQTWLWGGGGHIAGFYRLLAERRYFTGSGDAIRPVSLPPPPPGATIRAAAAHFSPAHIVFSRLLLAGGQPRLQLDWLTAAGAPVNHWQLPLPAAAEPDLSTFALCGHTLYNAGGDGLQRFLPSGQTATVATAAPIAAGDRLYAHPAGLLVQHRNELWLLSPA